MIYLKEPNTNRIVEFESEASIGAGFINWLKLNESEIAAHELKEVKQAKIKEIKAQRDANLLKPTPQTVGLYSGNIANRSFNINVKEHLGLLSGIIIKLQRIIDSGENLNPTRHWTDANGESIEMDINDFTSLYNHLDDRDAMEYRFCSKRVDEVKNMTSIEEVKAFDITKIYE